MPTPITDSDRHVVEPIDMWAQYVPTQYHEWIPYLEHNPKSTQAQPQLPYYMIKGKPLFNKWNENEKLQQAIANKSSSTGSNMSRATHPEAQLASMDETDIAKAYLFPTYAPFIISNENVPADISLIFTQAYNAWLFDYCKIDNTRLKGVGLISRHDPSTLLSQLDRIIHYGWHCVAIRPEKICERVVGHPDNNAFWAACAENNIAVAFHGGTHIHAPTSGESHFHSHFALHACSHPHEAQMAFLSLLEAGVLERNPTLKIAFLEGGSAWLPHWLWRLDEVCYSPLKEEIDHHITMKPSEYFKRQCWIGFEPDEPCLGEVLNWVGADRLLFGTDFPHPDHANFSISHLWQEGSPFSEEDFERILHTNPKHFFEQ